MAEINTSKNIFVFLGLLVIVFLVFVITVRYFSNQYTDNAIDFSSCMLTSGSVVQESYPRVCISAYGNRFVEKPLESTIQNITSNDWVCYPTYKTSQNTPELTAAQNYSQECFDKEDEISCMGVDIYNQAEDSFSTPDGIADCLWDTKINYCVSQTRCDGPVPCMANPAAVFCTCMGGAIEIRENPDGQYGVCKINELEYDEWEYFRKMNPTKDITTCPEGEYLRECKMGPCCCPNGAICD